MEKLNRKDINRIVEETVAFVKEKTGGNPILMDLVFRQVLNYGHVGLEVNRAYCQICSSYMGCQNHAVD